VLSVCVKSIARDLCALHCHNLTGTIKDTPASIVCKQRVQQTLHDCTAALTAYDVQNSSYTQHQQTTSSDSSGSSSNDAMKHMPSYAATTAAIEQWLLSNA
jgi:3-polyprenyl-4-hydroxybenzoate decarboxylase